MKRAGKVYRFSPEPRSTAPMMWILFAGMLFAAVVFTIVSLNMVANIGHIATTTGGF